MYYKKLLKRLKECSKMHVPITKDDRIKYKELYLDNPQTFRKNVTKQHYMRMVNWTMQGKVWKEAISGTVRHGKSEVAKSRAMLYIDIYNIAYSKGIFNDQKKQGINYKSKKLNKLNVNQILFSQSNFLYTLRNKLKNDKLILGEPTIIDEDEDSIGGLGSMSEKFEIDNLNNITAQAVQVEWQIRPDRFVLKNTVYGLFQEKMDRINKINWSMLYEIRIEPTASSMYRFLGWIATPLHEDEELRIAYNKKKRENINKVIEGTADLRLLERIKVSKLIAVDENFKQRTTNGKIFKLNKYQQECILNEWIIEKKVQNFNSSEKQEIVEHARMIAEKIHNKQIAEGDA